MPQDVLQYIFDPSKGHTACTFKKWAGFLKLYTRTRKVESLYLLAITPAFSKMYQTVKEHKLNSLRPFDVPPSQISPLHYPKSFMQICPAAFHSAKHAKLKEAWIILQLISYEAHRELKKWYESIFLPDVLPPFFSSCRTTASISWKTLRGSSLVGSSDPLFASPINKYEIILFFHNALTHN